MRASIKEVAGERLPDQQSVIQAGDPAVKRRMPPDPEKVRALFGRMVRQVWTPAEIDIWTVGPARRCSSGAIIPAADWQVTGK